MDAIFLGWLDWPKFYSFLEAQANPLFAAVRAGCGLAAQLPARSKKMIPLIDEKIVRVFAIFLPARTMVAALRARMVPGG